MTNDTIVRPRFGAKPREEATCTHAVPSASPDASHLERSNLRDLAPQEEETLGRVGLNTDQWPGMAVRPARQVADRELRELRRRFLVMARAAGTREQCHRQMAEADMLERVELETLAARIGEMLGDDDDPEPRGAA